MIGRKPSGEIGAETGSVPDAHGPHAPSAWICLPLVNTDIKTICDRASACHLINRLI
jgi:hypothetical protein